MWQLVYNESMKRMGVLVVSLILPYAAGLIGSLATEPAIETWYSTLQKPFFSPPNSVFAPIWIVLYLLMGLALYLVWSHKGLTHQPVRLFMVHLVVNAVWSLAFFGLQSPLFGLLIIVPLVIVVGVLIKQFSRTSKLAAWLLAPYFAWLLFATALNLSIWYLN